MNSLSTRRRLLVSLGSLAAPFGALAQQAPRMARIGFLSFLSASLVKAGGSDPFREGLAELGYIEGRNIQIEYRYADGDGDRLIALAAELVAMKVDVILTYATGLHAARGATTTIPIVMANGGDPVVAGFAASLAHPGGNVTGLTFFLTELMAKRLELLKEVRPAMTRCGVLLARLAPLNGPVLEAMSVVAKALKVTLHPIEVRGPADFEPAFVEWAGRNNQGLVVQDHPQIGFNAKLIAELAAKHRLPVIGNLEVVASGSLLGYGVNFAETFRRAAALVDKILKGTKAGDIPIERATSFRFVLNLKTAEALGITIPQSVLLRADEVIQ